MRAPARPPCADARAPDAHSRAHGYASPPRRGGAYPPRAGRAPPDPYAMEPNPATLRQFAEWFRCTYPAEAKREDDADRLAEKEAGRKTRDGIRARWEKYKKQHGANQVRPRACVRCRRRR